MKTVFFDIDTQLDFLYPAGALYVPGAERILDAIVQLNQHAASRGIPVVSSMDAHAENDPEFREWPPHCVAGTSGQQKPARTLLEPRFTIPIAPGDYAIEGARQIIVEKQQLDLFTNPNLPRLLERLGADRYVVYGVVTEFCVRCAALGLARLGKPVEIVGDAICGLQEAASRRTIDEVAAAGGRLTGIAEVCGRE
ncbi:MAG TPA: cysteine hydrolase family protein [Bryobacteraceae bacterium]|nr:cysteine hydrolase family protein [Bryobacteraceae bacterium]